MYRNIICLIVAVGLLLPGLIGCASTEDSPTMTQFNALQAVVTRLQSEEPSWNAIAAQKPTYDAYNGKISVLEGKAQVDLSSINTSITNLQSKVSDNSTMDRLQQAITALQNRLGTNTNTYTNTGANVYNPNYSYNNYNSNTGMISGGTTVSGGNGGVLIQQYGYSQPLVTNGTWLCASPSNTVVSQTYSATLTCQNGVQVPQLFTPTITITPAYSNSSSAAIHYCYVTSTSNNGNAITYTYPSNIYSGPTSALVPSGCALTLPTTTQLLMVNASGGGWNNAGSIYVVPGSGGQVFLTITVTLGASTGIPWNISMGGISVNAYNY